MLLSQVLSAAFREQTGYRGEGRYTEGFGAVAVRANERLLDGHGYAKALPGRDRSTAGP